MENGNFIPEEAIKNETNGMEIFQKGTRLEDEITSAYSLGDLLRTLQNESGIENSDGELMTAEDLLRQWDIVLPKYVNTKDEDVRKDLLLVFTRMEV